MTLGEIEGEIALGIHDWIFDPFYLEFGLIFPSTDCQ
jgi:hypothetical protein